MALCSKNNTNNFIADVFYGWLQRGLVSGLEQSTCAELGEEIVEMQMGWVVHSHFVKDTEAIS